MNDSCILCDGVQGPDHTHACAHCGAELRPDTLLSVGNDGEVRRVYCNRYCLRLAEPGHELLNDIPAEAWAVVEEREKIRHEMAQLRRRAEEAGVTWA